MKPKVYIETSIPSYLTARNGMNYLLTWNCKHIANAAQQSIIYSICKSAGFKSPIICTPLQLIGD